jgi:hypothetical protein
MLVLHKDAAKPELPENDTHRSRSSARCASGQWRFPNLEFLSIHIKATLRTLPS